MNYLAAVLTIAALLPGSPLSAAELSGCYCDKELLPQPATLVPGRKYGATG